MQALNLTIDGMSCGHCVSAVQKALNAVPGVKVERVTVGAASVLLDPEVATQAQVNEAVARAGYTVAAAYPGAGA